MKNLINVLLYVLLGLLVVTIAVMVYKKFKAPAESQTVSDVSEQTFMDTTGTQALPFSAEDSMILGLTGELPTQVGPESESGSAPIQENVSPVAKPVANHETESSATTKTMTEKAETKEELKKSNTTTVKSESTKQVSTSKSTEKAKVSNKSKTQSNGSTSAATTSKGNYYVISGSFLVPANADKQVNKLKKMGFFNASKKVFTNSSSYSAIAGQYETEAAARASLKKLKSKGEEGFIKKM